MTFPLAAGCSIQLSYRSFLVCGLGFVVWGCCLNNCRPQSLFTGCKITEKTLAKQTEPESGVLCIEMPPILYRNRFTLRQTIANEL